MWTVLAFVVAIGGPAVILYRAWYLTFYGPNS